MKEFSYKQTATQYLFFCFWACIDIIGYKTTKENNPQDVPLIEHGICY